MGSREVVNLHNVPLFLVVRWGVMFSQLFTSKVEVRSPSLLLSFLTEV